MKTDCCCPAPTNPAACGCCEGVEALTPLSTANRLGLPALSYRIGTHATFLETMKARLSSSDYPKLAELTSHEADNPAIALLDAWATVGDVLTFYQERIANEGYLHTATERRSVLELARLVGYQPRPGVASSVYLAYTLDDNFKEETIIPKGARSQSMPGPPGELPQSFETSEDLKARAKWNNLKPRMTQPQTEKSIRVGDGTNPHLYLKGISTNLRPNDPLLIDFGSGTPEFHRVKEVKPDAAANRTLVTLQSMPGTQASMLQTKPIANQVGLITELTKRPSPQLANSLRLVRKLEEQFTPKAEAGYTAVSTFAPVLRETLATAAANARVTSDSGIKVYALRVKASLFGSNAPREPQYEPATLPGSGEFLTPQPNPNAGNLKPQAQWPEWTPDKNEKKDVLYLDNDYDKILPGSFIAITKPTMPTVPVYGEIVVESISRNAYGISSKTTKITLKNGDEWWAPDKEKDIALIRTTTVNTQSEELELAEEPIGAPICGAEQEIIELDDFYEGLETGRWVVVSGEREIAGTSGVKFNELAMLSVATQDTQKEPQSTSTTGSEQLSQQKPLAGDKTHTFIKLAEKLHYCFKRETVTIYGNVVKATHAETRKEVLGSGDGAKALQSFVLKQPPLTFISASNPSGVDSTLKVYVNDVQWREADSLAGLSPTDRNFITKTDNEAKTTVIFGNGREGARLPTGIENVKAEYRNGIGKSGNVKAGLITLLTTRPLGVKEVINPLRASGGADRENRDQARKNAPLAVKALDRLVSVQDYEDFARTYAGIGKARAVELPDGRRQLVHITIAGADDIPIDEHSDLYRNLRQALRDFGDPYQAIQLEIRELMLIVISAGIRILPEYQWEPVVTQVGAALLDAFGFEQRELGQDVLLSEVISVMQAVRGVAYVDVDAFGGVPEKKLDQGQRRLLTPDEIGDEVQTIVTQSKTNGPAHRVRVNLAKFEDKNLQPAQLAFLTPEVPATLILNQIA